MHFQSNWLFSLNYDFCFCFNVSVNTVNYLRYLRTIKLLIRQTQLEEAIRIQLKCLFKNPTTYLQEKLIVRRNGVEYRTWQKLINLCSTLI